MKNLKTKYYCFGETDDPTITQEMKDRALPLLMLMVLKRNGDLKTWGVVNGSRQHLCADKND